MTSRNFNRLAAVQSNQKLLATQEAHAEEYKAVLTYGLVEQVTQPLQVVQSTAEFMPLLGCMASLANKALTGQYNALIACAWRDDTPSVETVNANAPKVAFQPWDEDMSEDPEADNGQERLHHDVRSFEEIEARAQVCRSIVHSLSNIKGVTETRWLAGTVQRTLEVQGDGTTKIVTVPHIPCAYRSIQEFVMDRMATNQHRDGLWFTKQMYFRMSRPDYDTGYAHGEIHELKAEFSQHLEEEIIVDEQPTTRLELYVRDIANRKFAAWLEAIKQGKSGSADQAIWIAYSTDRMAFAERFMDSLEMEEYLQAEEEAAAKLAERTAKLARFNALKAGTATPVEKAVVQAEQAPALEGVKFTSIAPRSIASRGNGAVGFSPFGRVA